MRTGIVVTARPGVEELAAQAEELGFSSFWVYDTPMLHGDPFLALGLCTQVTSRIKLGIGVTSPALRSIPAAANALASLNALAPGRIICGVGTGNTARRTLDDDEDPYGDAARDATGHLALSLLAFAAEEPAFASRLGAEERDAVQHLLDRRGTTAAAPDRYHAIYTNYLGRIAPADRDLVLPSLVDQLALVGTRDQLVARIAALQEAGIDEIVIQPVVDPLAEMAELAKLTHLSRSPNRTSFLDNRP